MRSGSAVLGVILIGAGAAGGCSSFKNCGEVACVDSFFATVRSADGSIPAGAHRVEVLVGASSLTCAFTFPPPMTRGEAAQPACDGGMGVAIWPETTCTATGDASQSCDPIPDKLIETIGLAGTPGQVHVWQYVDDAPILDVAAAPTYQSYAPNGAECGPICRQASVSWTFD